MRRVGRPIFRAACMGAAALESSIPDFIGEEAPVRTGFARTNGLFPSASVGHSRTILDNY